MDRKENKKELVEEIQYKENFKLRWNFKLFGDKLNKYGIDNGAGLRERDKMKIKYKSGTLN